jgi:hypothetical protein
MYVGRWKEGKWEIGICHFFASLVVIHENFISRTDNGRVRKTQKEAGGHLFLFFYEKAL